MARKKALKWDRQRDKQTTGGRTKEYLDYVTECGQWWLAEGLDESDRKRGKPWLLMHRREKGKGPWERVDTFCDLAEGKNFAEEMT